MESFNVNIHLPPRKRLLAELKKENPELDFLPPVPFISGDLGAQLRDVVRSPNSTLEEIVEVSKSVALAADEIAVAARNSAVEKAAAAAKAKVAAKSALLFLDSISRNRDSSKVGLSKTKVRKKQIPIKLLYKTNHAARSQKTDEDLARKLHHAMNSSPRISRSKHKKLRNSGKEALNDDDLVCCENSHDLHGGVRLSNKSIIDKSEKKILVSSKANIFDRPEESKYYTQKQHNGSKLRVIADLRNVGVKRKKLPLSQCDGKDQSNQETLLSYGNRHSFNRDSDLNFSESRMSSEDAKSSNDGGMSMNITSTWECKKIKVSQCSSDNKVLNALC
ncbi:hypothetical protein Cni_G27710 [Canna indica]|uniref:Uncharacterized protein n=1 Tax=Canna indica TaxID=4628 RepID=A0AAQ3QRL5_9LILI|nr:hypothetical protein Cni_G27710 [Canna indica]